MKTLQTDQIKDLKTEFEKLDTDMSGFLEVNELRTAIEKAHKDITPEELDSIIKEVDYANNEKINYTEFLSATINVKKFMDTNRLRAIFNAFDIDNTGQITTSNLHQSFSKFGREITKEEIDTIMAKHDMNKQK